MAPETNKPHKRSGAHFASASSADASAAPSNRPSRRRSKAVSPSPLPSSGRSAAGFGSGASRSSAGLDEVSSDVEAPRPIGVDPAETGAFQTLSAGQGAVITTRATAGEAADAARTNLGSDASSMRLKGRNLPRISRRRAGLKTDKRLFIGLAIAAVVVVAILFVIFNNAYNSTGSSAQSTAEAAQTQVAVDQTITSSGYVYALSQQPDGRWALTRTAPNSSSPLVLFELNGTPVSLVLYNGALIIPENLDSSWDVIAFVPGDGSVSTQLSDSSGNAIDP